VQESQLLRGFENALVSTLITNAYIELEQPGDMQQVHLSDHLHRLQSSINQSLLTPENRLHLQNVLQQLHLKIDHTSRDRLNPYSDAIVMAFSHHFTKAMPASVVELLAQDGLAGIADIIQDAMHNTYDGNDPVAVHATILATTNLLNASDATANFRYRVRSLNLPDSQSTQMNSEFASRYQSEIVPLLQTQLQNLTTARPKRTAIHQMPGGPDHYRARFALIADATPTDIHKRGQTALVDIHRRITQISTLKLDEFLNKMRQDPANYFPNSHDGRQQYLSEVYDIIDKNQYDIALPPLIVKRVDPYRAQHAPLFHYFGSTVHINLDDMQRLPLYEMPTQVRFYSIPGLHLGSTLREHKATNEQVIAFASYLACATDTSKIEELLYLAGEFALLVTDTGIHNQKWTEAEASTYLFENTALPEARIKQHIDEIFIEPGQWILPALGRMQIQALAVRYNLSTQIMQDFLLVAGPQSIASLNYQLSKELQR